jgi:hypothetical protein
VVAVVIAADAAAVTVVGVSATAVPRVSPTS